MSTTDTTGTDQLPQAGTWQIDPAHTSVNFAVRHLGMSKVRGSFKSFGGTLEIAEDAEQSSVTITIDPASVDTGQPDRDGHLQSADFFDVENHPEWTFRSTTISREDDDWVVEGELTIHGVTQQVTLDVEYLGMVDNPLGEGKRIAFEAEADIKRKDFGLTWDGPQTAAGAMVGNKVTIDLDVQFVGAQ